MDRNTNLAQITTEARNPASMDIDTMPTLRMLETINAEDAKIAGAVREVLPLLAEFVDAAHDSLSRGGRVFYVGAGTSGRLGVLDASECPPTYGASPELFQGVIAGGYDALVASQEGAEDDAVAGTTDLEARFVSPDDVVVGLAASGRTPYVIGALDYAGDLGCVTASIACTSPSEIGRHARYAIECVVGPEIVTGSTRMKAGTAQKMILNMISTSLMVKAGKVYGNLMVDVQPTNEKLVARAVRIISEACGIGEYEASEFLDVSGGNVKIAICMALTGSDAQTCRKLLADNHDNVAKTIRSIKS